jgi:hypothetical protein
MVGNVEPVYRVADEPDISIGMPPCKERSETS